MLSCSRRAARLIAVIAACALLAAPVVGAQSNAQIEALKKEIEALKLRQDALQKEVDALKIQPRPAPNAAPAPGNIVLDLSRAPMEGNAAARVILVEASDFECPFCGRHFNQTASRIHKDYVATGKIRHAFVQLPLRSHRNAFKAAEASICAGDQGKFWEMHRQLFMNQRQLTPNILPAYADAIGLNAGQFRACLDSGRHAALVTSDIAMVNRAGATATPTFFVGILDPKTQKFQVTERVVGAKSYAAFQQSLDSAIVRSKAQ